VKEDELAAAVRAALVKLQGVTEVKMFGGVGFMLNGNLLVGASKRGLLARVGRAAQAQALAHPGAAVMEMKGRRMEDYIRVSAAHLDTAAIRAWIKLARAHVETLPPKAKTKR